MVANAIRYGEGWSNLAATERNGQVELHVLDEGSAFGPRFSRADPARSRGGAGLGLSIVRLIAEAHGGGADVWVSLPR